MRPLAPAYSHHGHGPRAEQTGRIHISDFRYPADILLRNAAGPYIWVSQRLNAAADHSIPLFLIIGRGKSTWHTRNFGHLLDLHDVSSAQGETGAKMLEGGFEAHFTSDNIKREITDQTPANPTLIHLN